jgi:hypothetical protein
MSRLDALPADQKAVLQLLLRQGKGYDDLSGLLHLEPDAVRSRAYDALDALGPGPGGLSAERRHAISDWLLGQQVPEDAAATRTFLEQSSAGRAWGRAVAGELEPLAGDRLPELPADGQPPTDVHTPVAPAATAPLPVSRRGGALLIGGAVALIAIGVTLFLVLRNDDNKPKESAAPAAATTSTQSQPKVKAQAALTPPDGAPAKKAAAIVQLADIGSKHYVNAVAQGLPNVKKVAYGIWAYSGPSQAKLLGGFDQTDNQGHLVYQGQLTQDVSGYNEILVTRETSGRPKRPGQVYLRGKITATTGTTTGSG